MEHDTAMPTDTHSQRVLDLASQKGLLRASDLDAIDAPRVILTRMTAAGLLDRVGRGLYRLLSVVTSRNTKASWWWWQPKRRRPCSACSPHCSSTG